MPDWLIGLIGVAVTFSLGVLTVSATRRGGDRERIGVLEARLDKVEARDRAWENYAAQLRDHIYAGNKPPPPPFPPELTR